MRDTSEMPDGPEQAKSGNPKARTSTRSRSDSFKAGGQEQETRPAARRRTPTNTQTATTAPGQPQDERSSQSSASPTPSSSTAAQAHAGTPPAQSSAPSTSSPRPAGSPYHSAGGPSHQQGGTGTSNSRSGHWTPAQHGAGPASSQRSTTSSQQGRPSSSYQQRPSPGQRSGNGPANGPGQGQRTTGYSSQTSGARPAFNQRSGGSAPTQQRQGYTPHQQRPGSGTGHPSQGEHAGSAQRTHRPNGPAPANNRPGGGHGQARQAGKSNSQAQRTQERRAPVVKEKPTGPVSIPPQILVKDLAETLHTTVNELIRGLIKHGIFASINQVVEYDKAALVAQDLGFEPSQSAVSLTASQNERTLSANEVMMATRHEDHMVVIPPVVTIMGHVDHGKTSLLDVIRETKVAAGEAGGITQHIGAYQVEVNGKKITFLDTPGHEAFTAMRARGAQVTHIVIIVIAADDGVMPQTREAIDHARAAKVPIIIALNKIDKANANPDRVKQQLAEIDVVIEEYGGETVCVPVSARKGTGIDELLEYILLVAEVQDIKGNPNRPATGVIVEAKLEKNSGPSATVLVQQGTLKMGDNIVVGLISGKVRAMFNDRGKRIQKAPPSAPVSIIGLPEVPQAGDRLEVMPDERAAKQRAQKEVEKRREESTPLGQVSLDTLYMQMQEGKVKELNLILKCDVQGSAEAIKNSLTKVGEENLKVRLIHEGIGNISETDVHLAGASGAIIIGFNVKADGAAQREAQREGVDIRYYDVIYKLIDDIQAALTGMLEPTLREVIEGHAEVLQTFKAGKTIIAGCRITDGKITRSAQARVLRSATKVYDGKIASLRRGKDDVREVATGYECGIVLEDFTDLEIGDIIEVFSQEHVKP